MCMTGTDHMCMTGTDHMCMTGTVNIHTGPDQPNPDVPLQPTDSLNLTLNAHQPSG